MKAEKAKVTTETIKRYYVQIGDWIYGGPFDTREEAVKCVREYCDNEVAKRKVAL